ncbi:MAG: response regulator transcription factor [Chloroflexota bacterium]|nr:response regulator transcription factor [Chloroflexota bacterium]
MIRVLLVDDHTSVRQPLAFMLAREPDITVVAQAGSLSEARPVLKGVDVAVIDLDLPDGNGADLVLELREANPDSSVLILTASDDRKQWARAVEAGAAGVMHKSADIEEIISGVRRLGEDQFLFSPREIIEMMQLAAQQREHDLNSQRVLDRLTPREREVLQALADGLSDKEIAERLQIETKTARAHMVNLLGKLGVQSRLQALVFAVRHGAARIH